MGKWTPQYYDDVLGNKFKTLVCAVLEEEQQKRELSDESDSSEGSYREFTYESFVHSLARGENDDFLKPVVELLVKEFIDRQQKPGIASKRHHISLRTAESLRTLLGHNDSYRMSHIRSYRGNAHEEWGADFQPPPLDTMDDPSLGTDFYTPTYDAYYPAFASLSTTSRPVPMEPVIPRWHFETLGSLPPLRRSGTQPSMSRSGSSDLTRQSSIRRHNRSRMVDFTEFASRRRANGRTTLVEPDTVESSPEPQPYGPDSESEGSSYPALITATTAISARGNSAFDPVRDAATRDMLEGPVVEIHHPSTSQSSRHGAPRLRRGGVRAPEMAFVPSPLSSADWPSSSEQVPPGFSPPTRDPYEPPIRRFPSYLTPRSSSPEPSLSGTRLS